jgi:hypothetical protein
VVKEYLGYSGVDGWIIEIPTKIRGIHPEDNHIHVDLSGSERKANVIIYTNGSKMENHVGASMVAIKGSGEIYINTQRLSITCTVFQVELYGLSMAVDWNKAKERNPPTRSTLTPKQHYSPLQINTRHIL